MEVKPQKSPNLLRTALPQRIEVIEKHHPKISTGAKLLIIFAQALFIFALGLNEKTVRDIDTLQFEIRGLENQILAEQENLGIIEETLVKTARMKQLEKDRIVFTEKLEKAIKLIPNKVDVTRTATTNKSFDIVIQTDTALEASVLMFLYLENDVAERIILKNADYKKTTGEFSTNLEVIFKQ